MKQNGSDTCAEALASALKLRTVLRRFRILILLSSLLLLAISAAGLVTPALSPSPSPPGLYFGPRYGPPPLDFSGDPSRRSPHLKERGEEGVGKVTGWGWIAIASLLLPKSLFGHI